VGVVVWVVVVTVVVVTVVVVTVVVVAVVAVVGVEWWGLCIVFFCFFQETQPQRCKDA